MNNIPKGYKLVPVEATEKMLNLCDCNLDGLDP